MDSNAGSKVSPLHRRPRPWYRASAEKKEKLAPALTKRTMEPTIDLNITSKPRPTAVAQNHAVSMLRRRGFRVESKPWHRD